MQGLNIFTDLLNNAVETKILSKGKKFTGYKLFGVTSLVTAQGKTFPAVFIKEGQYAGIDDRFPVIIYHRANQVNIVEPPKSGYGNQRSALLQATFNMVMVVYIDKKVTCLKDDEMLLLLLSGIPEGLTVADWSDVNIKTGSAILNQQQVFQSEYKGVQFFLNPESSLFSVSYTIEGRFKRGCFNYCPED